MPSMRTAIVLTALVTTVAIAAGVPGTAQAGKIVECKDDQGNSYFTTTPPPDCAKKGHRELDEQGRTVGVQEREKTDEELAAQRAEEQRQAELQLQKEAQRKHDQMLLNSYLTVEDMELARDGRIALIDAQIRATSENISRLEQQLVDLEQRRKAHEEKGEEVPEALTSDIEQARKSLLENQRYVQARGDEKEEIREQFARDIARFKELKGIGDEEGSSSGS